MLTPALALLCLVATPTAALSPGDISAAARTTTSGLTVVRRLASDGLGGRDNATPESARAQRYILRRLRRLGDDAYRQPFVQSGQSGTNLLVVVRGRELPDEYVIVGAHYDHLGTRSAPDGTCRANGTPGGAVCNGATDNAAGVAAVLGVGRALRRLPSRPRRSIVLALWDAEEDGLLGSL
jgi:acetylornithine deacetylase/succinyl-diaminopimelate desuccinylase-like protein